MNYYVLRTHDNPLWEITDMTHEPMNPTERAYMREAFSTSAGVKFLAQLMALKPKLAPHGSIEETAMSAKILSGYETCISNMSSLLYENQKPPELKGVDIATN